MCWYHTDGFLCFFREHVGYTWNVCPLVICSKFVYLTIVLFKKISIYFLFSMYAVFLLVPHSTSLLEF